MNPAHPAALAALAARSHLPYRTGSGRRDPVWTGSPSGDLIDTCFRGRAEVARWLHSHRRMMTTQPHRTFCSPSHPITTTFDRIAVINLPYRIDRRLEMARELARVGLSWNSPQVQLFEAIRPPDAGAFETIGTRGCFLSHLGVLKSAYADGVERLLILEDDAHLSRRWLRTTGELVNQDWDLLYLGHRLMSPGPAALPGDDWLSLSPHVPVVTAHALGVSRSALGPMVDYFDRMLQRPAGDPQGGPMHVDGAYSWFRADHPHFETLIAVEQLITQRSSRTDIHELGWKERLPLIGPARRFKTFLRTEVYEAWKTLPQPRLSALGFPASG